VLHELAVPYVDARASGLSWWLGDDAPAPLATLVLPGPGGPLELRLLGASHHVVAHAGGARCAEVVACGSRSTALPAWHDGELAGARYRFTSSTSTYSPPAWRGWPGTCAAGRAERRTPWWGPSRAARTP
jgi:hypothetical protein